MPSGVFQASLASSTAGTKTKKAIRLRIARVCNDIDQVLVSPQMPILYGSATVSPPIREPMRPQTP